MKNLIIVTILTLVTLNAFSQTTNTVSYGPVPYRTPEQTIGEDYAPTPPP